MGRPPLTADQVQAKLLRYCARYHASVAPGGYPVFPAGKRESKQHKEWLTVYRAVQRLKVRQVPEVIEGPCQICGKAVTEGVQATKPGRKRLGLLHASCAKLADQLQAAGPETFLGLKAWLGKAYTTSGNQVITPKTEKS